MTPKLFQITGRLAQAIPSVLVVIILSFILTRMLPGDPAVYFAGDMADNESIEQMRRSLGLDQAPNVRDRRSFPKLNVSGLTP